MASSPTTVAPAMPDGSSHEDRHSAAVKRKRNLPGTPDPEAEVIALSPTTLMATNRFLCEVCGKGFQRDQNLQLHRRGHNLPWKLKQRDGQEVKRRVYVCPEPSCVHHEPSRALGDLTGIKKHFSRKHGEKKWKCEKCSKQYAVHSDWKAHLKVCGTREYRCSCGTFFSRKDSFVTHRAFCDALAQENANAAAHQLAETQHSSDTSGNVIKSPTGDLSTVVEASPSPFQKHAVSEKPHSQILQPLGKDMWEASSAVNGCDGPKGLQFGLSPTPSNPMMGSGLSLSLSAGLGPGPPCPSKFNSSLSQPLVSLPSSMMNELVDAPPEEPAKISFSSPFASAVVYKNLLAAANGNVDFQQLEKAGSDGISDTCLSMAVNTVTDARAVSQFATSTYSNDSFFTPRHQQQNTRSVQLPATTLLQKAALMGVTKSKPFLFQSLDNSCSLYSQDSRESSSGAVVTKSLPSSWQSLSMQPGVEGIHLDCGPGYGQGGRNYTRDGLGVSRLESMPRGSSSSLSGIKGASLFDGQMDHEMLGLSVLSHGSSRFSGLNIATCTELEESQKEKTNRLTLDFLGLGDGVSFQEGSSNILDGGKRPRQFSCEDT